MMLVVLMFADAGSADVCCWCCQNFVAHDCGVLAMLSYCGSVLMLAAAGAADDSVLSDSSWTKSKSKSMQPM